MKTLRAINEHPALSCARETCAIVLIAILLMSLALKSANASDITGTFKNGVYHVNAVEAHSLLSNSKTVQVLDVRTPREFQQGHIEGAINVDYYADDFAEQLTALDPNIEYLIHCRSGVRSGKSLAILKSVGIKKLIHLDGGIKAWLSSGFPLTALYDN